MITIKDVITDKISGEWGDEAAEGQGVVIIRTANFLNSGKINFSNLVRREIDLRKVEKKKLISGDIIIEKSGGSPTQPVGRVVIFKSPDNEIYLCNNFTSILRPNKNIIHPEFLFYILRENHRIGKTLRFQNKTTGIINLKLDDYLDSEISVPPLADQIRIAHLLGKVESLIAQRKQALQQLDELLKSVFLEMFGDPVKNEKGWKDYLFSKLFSDSPRIGTTKPVSSDGRTPVVRVGELGEFQVNFKNCKNVNLEDGALEKCRVEIGDILLARAIASQSHLGKASLITYLEQDTAFDSHVMRIRFNNHLVNPFFAYHWLKSDGGRSLFLNAGGQTSVQFNINSKQISSITMPLPPIDLQNQFATIVEKIESLKSRYKQSLSDLEALYGALSQKAFKGELDLSRVPLLESPQAPVDRSPERSPVAPLRTQQKPLRPPQSPAIVEDSGAEDTDDEEDAAIPKRRLNAAALQALSPAVEKLLHEKTQVTSAEVQASFQLSGAQARKILQGLVDASKVRIEGAKKGTRYLAITQRTQ